MEQQRLERELQQEIEEEEKRLKNRERKGPAKKTVVVKRRVAKPKVRKVQELRPAVFPKEEGPVYVPKVNKIPENIIQALSFHDFSQDLGADRSNCFSGFV